MKLNQIYYGINQWKIAKTLLLNQWKIDKTSLK